jgi:hypothetical protein
MAGAGVRVFLPGEVLTATLVNTYLQDQVVAIFDTPTARDAAFGDVGNILDMPELVEGRVCYIRSLNDIQYYSGSAWVSITAGSVLNLITAKGDLLAATAAGALDNVAVGANDYVLIADSTEPTGIKWGKIQQAGIDDGVVTNDMLAGSIADTKLSTISTALKVSNSATSADSTLVNNAIVLRDGSGNFAANKATLNSIDVISIIEKANIVASAAAGVVSIEFSTNPTVYYTSNATANWTVNIIGTSTAFLNDTLAIGQIASVTFLATIGTSEFRPVTFQVDGNAVTPKWMGGVAPTTGNASSIDSYTFSVIKTGNAAFTMLASQSRFA